MSKEIEALIKTAFEDLEKIKDPRHRDRQP